MLQMGILRHRTTASPELRLSMFWCQILSHQEHGLFCLFVCFSSSEAANAWKDEELCEGPLDSVQGEYRPWTPCCLINEVRGWKAPNLW